jgi:tetratricopeptide (TPR) repeat protein
MTDFPQIFTFYSFKGGVGRSMAVLNVAYSLVAKGRNVLVLDMDLEAPGLSGFLHRHREIGDFARHDMVDLVRWATDFSITSQQASEHLDSASFPPLSDFIVSVPRGKLESLPHPYGELGRLDIVLVDEERDYYGRLTALAMGSFEQDALIRVGSILHAWLKSRRFAVEVPDYYGPNAERTAAYDYVLVDSRTGVTETGGLCIGPLSDQLVVLTALNDQNVEGTRHFLEEVGILGKQPSTAPEDVARRSQGARRLDPKPTLIVASPVPASETKLKRERLRQLEAAVGKAVVKLSYYPQMALFESIFVRDFRDEHLAGEYESLVKQVLRMANDGLGIPGARSIADLREAARLLLRSTWQEAVVEILDILPSFLDMVIDVEHLADDADYILWDRVCRVLSSGELASGSKVLSVWANVLSQWSRRSTHAHLATLRREAAMRCLEQVLQGDGATSQQKAAALINRGVMHGDLGDSTKAIADYTAVLQMPDSLADQKTKALVNRGWRHFVDGRSREAIEDEQQAISLDPKNCFAHWNLAISLLAGGRTNEALAACDAGLALADAKDLAQMASNLETATQKHGPLARADEVLARIEARRKSLEH